MRMSHGAESNVGEVHKYNKGHQNSCLTDSFSHPFITIMWMVSCADPRTGCRSRRVKCVRLFDLGVFQVFETKALVCFQERVLAPFPV